MDSDSDKPLGTEFEMGPTGVPLRHSTRLQRNMQRASRAWSRRRERVEKALESALNAEIKEGNSIKLGEQGCDIAPFLPEPRTAHDVMRMKNREPNIFSCYQKAAKNELKNLITNNTFIKDQPTPSEKVTPCMEVYKAKILSDGTLDKLKHRIVVRGDLQQKTDEDNWSPTASIRSLHMFCAQAARVKKPIFQLDFIGAFLQAKVKNRIFVMLPRILGVLVPEYAEYCGVPLRLRKSMYGMTESSRFWFVELMEWLLSDEGEFQNSATLPTLYWTRKEMISLCYWFMWMIVFISLPVMI